MNCCFGDFSKATVLGSLENYHLSTSKDSNEYFRSASPEQERMSHVKHTPIVWFSSIVYCVKRHEHNSWQHNNCHQTGIYICSAYSFIRGLKWHFKTITDWSSLWFSMLEPQTEQNVNFMCKMLTFLYNLFYRLSCLWICRGKNPQYQCSSVNNLYMQLANHPTVLPFPVSHQLSHTLNTSSLPAHVFFIFVIT